ncbi:MAG TPA: hypothetical protein VE713_18885 [Pyrinomonadaceae bacterium]|nr:hypothetical protein [Pyrinomonadaceae bacterium]
MLPAKFLGAAPAGSFDAAAARGEALFRGKATCAQCRVPPLFIEPGWNTHLTLSPASAGEMSYRR